MRVMYRSRIIQWMTLGLVTVVFAACGDSGVGPDEDDGDGGGTGTPQLNFFEQELVGLWYRFHSFDGTDMYYFFDANGTACKWEEASGSNTRTSVGNYSDWSVSETEDPAGSGRYRVTIPGSGLTSGLTFDFPDNELFPTSFTNLKYRPSNAGKSCE